jgi:anaerobic selenocysteine-containing dehydrogenase
VTTEIKKSFCHLCNAECGILATVKNNQIIKITPDFDDPVSRGYICEKSQRIIEFQASPDRITSPLKKVNGQFIPISWEQAIDEIAVDIKPHLDNILYMAPLPPSYAATTMYSFELMAILGVQFATNVYSFEKAYTRIVNNLFFKTDVSPNRQEAQTLIVIGQNPWVTQHYPQARKILNDIKNNPSRTLIVIDPVSSETANIADIHINLATGTDAWLLTALIKQLITIGAIDQQFINDHTSNFDKVNQHFSNVSIDECLSICKISYDQLLELANIIKDSSTVAIDCGNGICHTVFPLANNYLITLLYLLTGNFQKLNAMESSKSLLTYNEHYLPENKTPITKQKQLSGIISGALLSDNLKFNCVIIDNSNPVERIPNSTKFKEQLSNATVIVLDSFMSASAKLADYILPTNTFFERYEYVNASHSKNGILQLSKPIISSSNTKSTNEIYELLLMKLNLLDEVKSYNTDSVEFYINLLEQFNQKMPGAYRILQNTIGANYQTPILAIVWWEVFRFNLEYNTIQQAIALTNTQIDQLDTTGKVNINTKIQQTHKIDLAPSFLLSTLRLSKNRLINSKYKFIVQCGHRQKSSTNGVLGNVNIPIIELDYNDATELGILDNEQIVLETSLTSITITCKLVSNSQPGLLRIANHPIINQLTDDNNVDYLSPQYKIVFANIRKINGNM